MNQRAHTWCCAGFTDNSSVSVVPNGDGSGVLSLTESVAGTYRASTADLSTLGRVNFKDGVEGLLTTAHPTVMKDGTMINLTSGVGMLHRPANIVEASACMTYARGSVCIDLCMAKFSVKGPTRVLNSLMCD